MAKKATLEIRESFVPDIKKLYPNIAILDKDFKIEELDQSRDKEFYIEDLVDYTEAKKLIGSVKHSYPIVIIRLGNTDLNKELINFLGHARYVFSTKDYTLLLAQKGFASPVFQIKEKFKCINVLSIKELN